MAVIVQWANCTLRREPHARHLPLNQALQPDIVCTHVMHQSGLYGALCFFESTRMNRSLMQVETFPLYRGQRSHYCEG